MRPLGAPRQGESGRVADRVRLALADRGGARPDEIADDADGDVEDEWAEEFDLIPSAPAPAHRAVAGMSSWWRRVVARVPLRLDPGRRAALAVGLAVLLAALLTGAWLLAARPRAMTMSSLTPSGGSGTSAATSAASPSAQSTGSPPVTSATAGGASSPSGPVPSAVVVDVAGKVRHPGVYRLPPGGRVEDAVIAAGGPLPGVDLSTLNLAAALVDGEQIPVGVTGAGPAAQPGGAAGLTPGATGAAGGGGMVDLNTATLEQLETLPGVGPVLGQHILDWRGAHGRFDSPEQLRQVSGIGDVKFAALRPRVSA